VAKSLYFAFDPFYTLRSTPFTLSWMKKRVRTSTLALHTLVTRLIAGGSANDGIVGI